MKKNIIILTGAHTSQKVLHNITEHLKAHYKITPELVESKTISEVDTNVLYLTCLSDSEIKQFFKKHMDSQLTVGIIPNEECPRAIRSYGVSKDIFESIDDAFNDGCSSQVDMLLCNGELVLNTIILGDVHGLNKHTTLNHSFYTNVKSFFTNLAHLKIRDYTLTTAKGQIVQTAATGIMVLEHNINSVNQNLIDEELSSRDGKLNALVLAPKSIVSYLYYLIMAFFYLRFSFNNIPSSIGLLVTSRLDITSSAPMDYLVDGISMSSKEVNIEVIPKALSVCLGRLCPVAQEKESDTENDKEVVKIQSLPKGAIKEALIKSSVPLFKKAEEEDFKELFLGLKENAVLSTSFVVLTVLSTLLATTGLFQNSAPVIIGAMILAPLMTPIISLSMGVVRAQQYLIKESAYTLLIGVTMALLFSCLYTYMTPLSTLTDEMRGRLNPNVLDLMVAVISGIAGAYANAKSEIAKSLAGVAIAVALVPPLSVTGIGIGWGDLELIYGSFLLFITNLIGITLAASMTFVVLGYAPIHRAKKGIVLTGIFLSIVAIPLVLSFDILIKQNRLYDRLESIEVMRVATQEVRIHALSLDLSKEKPFIAIEVHSHEVLRQEELGDIKAKIESVTGHSVVLSITPKIMMY